MRFIHTHLLLLLLILKLTMIPVVINIFILTILILILRLIVDRQLGGNILFKRTITATIYTYTPIGYHTVAVYLLLIRYCNYLLVDMYNSVVFPCLTKGKVKVMVNVKVHLVKVKVLVNMFRRFGEPPLGHLGFVMGAED